VVADDRTRLVDQLRSAGATDEEIAAAEAAGALGVLAIEIALRPDGEPLSFSGMVARTGVDADEAAALWSSLGLPDPRVSGVTIAAAEADVLSEVVAFADALGADAMAKITRVLGASAARVGEAVVEAMRVGFELPQLEQGTSYPAVVEQYTDLAVAAYPTLVQAFDFVLRRHLTAFARGAWMPSEDQRAMNLERLIGFVDLVDYTALSATLDHGDLPDLLSRFERAVAGIVTGAGGRIVKTIGDEVMFVVSDIAAGCAAAVELVAAMQRDELPPVRVGIAVGPVVGYEGDYFGDVVNLAARLVGAADPGSVLAPAAVTETATAAGVTVSAAEAVVLKGFTGPVDVVCLTGR
jgi:hypothetical protein